MVEFIYNNRKNTNTSHILFKLHYGYHPYIIFENQVYQPLERLFKLFKKDKLSDLSQS